MAKSKDLGGGYSHLREEREYDPDTSTLRRRLALDKKPGAKEHLKRNAASYAGAAAGLVGGRYAARKLSGMLKGKQLGGKTLAGLSRSGKMYAGGIVAGAGMNLGDKIDKGRANARIYEKLVKEGRIDAIKIAKETEDPRTDWPKSVVDHDRDLFKRWDKKDRLKRLEAVVDAALHRFEKLDLGYTYDEMYPTAPCGASGSDKKTQYPSLYVNRTKGDVMDIPETGKAVVEYVLTGRNMSKRDGKTTYGMDLQIKSFDPQGTKKAEAKMKKDGHAVALSSKFQVSSFKFSDRTRNGDGQFVGNVTGGADPVTMRQAYGDKKRSLLAPGAGAAALTAAGLLGGTAKGRVMLAGGLRKVEGLARTGRDKLQGRVRMSKPGRGKHREARPGFGEVLMRNGQPEGKTKLPGAMTRYHALLDAALTEFGISTGQRFVNKARTKVRRLKQSLAPGRGLDDRIIEANRRATRREAAMPSLDVSKIRQKTEKMLKDGLDPLGIGGHRALLAAGATGVAAGGGLSLALRKKKQDQRGSMLSPRDKAKIRAGLTDLRGAL